MRKIVFLVFILLGIIGLIFALKLYTFYKSTYIKSKGEIMMYGMRHGGVIWNGEEPPEREYCLIFDIRKGYSPGIRDKTRITEPCCPLYEGCD